MTMQIRKAERRKAKLRLGISALSGGGKTKSSLLIAAGIVGPKGRVGMVDTENGSGDLFANDKDVVAALPQGYDIINISAPFDPAKYIEAIGEFENQKYDLIITDSLSHAWAGVGGSLDKQGKEADKTGNSYTAWRKITPQHNALIEKIIQSPSHIIVTLRAKTDYVQEKNDHGKTVVRKVGLAPIMRDGIEYEFTVFGEMDQAHNFQASKDRTGLFGDQFFVPSKKTGEMLLAWLNSGAEALPVPTKTEAMLGDEIPDFDKKPEAKAPQEVPLTEQAKTYAELIKGALFIGELDNEVLTHAPLMGVLGKELPAWRDRLLALIEQKRGEFVEAPPAPKAKRVKKAVIDDGGVKVLPVSDELNDPLPPMTAAEHLEQQLKESA